MPVPVSGLSNVRAIAAGWFHTCALALEPSGPVSCWGGNDQGQLGDGSTTARLKPATVSVRLPGVVRAIGAGGRHTCTLLQGGGGTISSCWGGNKNGQLGDGTFVTSSVPVSVVGLTGVRAIALAGGYHTCALLNGGGVSCWGSNFKGQLGDNSNVDRNSPVSVLHLPSTFLHLPSTFPSIPLNSPPLPLNSPSPSPSTSSTFPSHLPLTSRQLPILGLTTGVVAIVAGGYHTCALFEAGTVSCWGSNVYGQLGDGTYTDRLTPVPVSDLSGVVMLTAGPCHTCATLREGGLLRCWGLNQFGQVTGKQPPPDMAPFGINVPSHPVECGPGKAPGQQVSAFMMEMILTLEASS